MADTHALGACAERRGGSTPFSRTNFDDLMVSTDFYIDFLKSLVGVFIKLAY